MSLPDVRLGGGDGPEVRTRRSDQPGPGPDPVGPGPTLSVVPDQASEDGPDLPEGEDRTNGPAVRRVPVWDRVVRVLRYCGTQVSDAFRRAGASRGPAEAQPESWRQFRARVNARGWLPDGYDGKFLIVVPTVFYNTVGSAGWGIGHAVVWLCTHMFAFMTAFLFVVAAVVLWLCFS